MSETSRGPLIQRQGYIKRAPSGKLSAFKKWEKKWCVFALSKRNGPVLDFFDDRSATNQGPAGAIGRVELKNTKQVCAAIQCKVPHTFIIVTDSKIVSLAALSRSDSESWISCLRRVLTNEGCLESSEDHTYEVSGNAITRQEQERLSRTRRRPPTPPGSDSDENALASETPPEMAPPPPVRHSASPVASASAPPVLPKRASKIATKRGALPPPVPTSNRPKLQENFSGLKRSSSVDDPTKNVLEVLKNYDESTDTTYEAGDRQAIRNASQTLDAKKLSTALQNYKDSEGSAALGASALTPLYSQINKQRPEDRLKRPPVAPRRVNTIQPRVEHDYSPQVAVRRDSSSDSSSSGVDMDAMVKELGENRRLHDLDDISDDDEGTYASMDPFFDEGIDNQNLATLAAAANDNQSSSDDDRYVEGPIIRSSAGSVGAPSPLPTTPVSEPFPLPPKEHKIPKAPGSPVPLHVDIDDNVYENSKTILPENGVVPKAVPFAAPRRAKSVVVMPSARVSPPKPIARKVVPQASLDDQGDTYENFLGEFGTGVSTLTGANHKKLNETHKLTSKLSRLQIGKNRPRGDIPLPKTPEDSDISSTPATGSTNTSAPSRTPPPNRTAAVAALADLNIPVADGESSCSSLGSPDAAATKPAEGASNGRDTNHIRKQLEAEIRLQREITSTASNSNSLPSDEAPPPYTPPRILNDSQHSPNMDCIAEINSEEDENAAVATSANLANHTQSVTHRPVTSSALSYDAHPAFDRSVHVTPSRGSDRPTHVTPSRGSDRPTLVAPDRGSNRPTLVAPDKGSDEPTNVAPDRGTNAGVTEVHHSNHSDIKPLSSPVSKKYSPHTPPGTPPLFARRKSVPSKPTQLSSPGQYDNSNRPSSEDVVLRLEDSFPRMRKQKPERSRSSYLEDVIAVSPPATGLRGTKSPLKKSFSVVPSDWKNYDKYSVDLNQPVPKAASTDALQPATAIVSSAAKNSTAAVAEYDHVIRQRLASSQQRMAYTDSSTDDGDSFVVQRRPKKSAESKQRRRSAPPNSLAVKSMMEMAAGAEASRADAVLPVRPPKDKLVAEPKQKSSRERRNRQPLDGGTLQREGKVFKAPPRDSKNVPLKQAQTELLQEEIAHSYGVKVTVYRKEVKYTLFEDFMNYIWVVGWNQKERPLLQNIFHIGDKILTVNNETFTSATKLSKLIKRSDSDTKFDFVLRRLPFGKAYFIHRNMDYEDMGIEVKANTAEVVKVVKGGLVSQQGLRVNPNRAFGSGQCHWVLTEVNHRPLNLLSTDSEAASRLEAVGKDISFVVQPMDFVEQLRKALKSKYGWKDYIVC